MNANRIAVAGLAVSMIIAAPAGAADQPATAPVAAAGCELHIWPTQNYLGINTGLLAGLGPVGVLADVGAHKNRVQTVKELMADYLGPDVQMAELTSAGVADMLKLRGYRIVVEEPTPFNEDVKKDPALKARTKAMNAKIEANQRLSASTSPCYAELITSHIFYHKAMMYGSNLFTGWIFRDFSHGPSAVRVARGQVKNPLENFPPKTPQMVDAAKVELRAAYGKDFAEYVQKKVQP